MLGVLINPGLFMVDDAWFYLQIGRNIGLGEGSTFDGIAWTNGYHPLWMAMVSAIALISGGHKTLMLYATLALQIGMAGMLLWQVHRVARRGNFAYPAFVMTAVVLTQLTDKGWGSEGMLTSALHVAVLWSWSRATRPGLTGVLLGLLFLARLDTVFFIFAVGLFTLPDFKRALILATTTTLTASPWLVWTYMRTGHLVPVSGAIKSVFPVPDLSNPYGKLGAIGVLTAIGSAVALLVALRTASPQKRRLLGALGLGATLHALYVTLFTAPDWSTFVPYYWVTGTLASGLVLGELLALYFKLLPSLSSSMRSKLAAVVIAGLALAGGLRTARSLAIAIPDSTVELAIWLGQTHPDAVVLTLDAPGRLAWFSGLSVVAADGLTQDYDFAETIEREGMPTWARERGVTHVMAYTIPIELPWTSITVRQGVPTVRFVAPGRDSDAGTLIFTEPIRALESPEQGTESMATLFAMPPD